MELFAVGAIITGIIGVGIHVFQSISNIGDIDLDFSGLSSGSFPVPQDLPVYDQPTENPELQVMLPYRKEIVLNICSNKW